MRAVSLEKGQESWQAVLAFAIGIAGNRIFKVYFIGYAITVVLFFFSPFPRSAQYPHSLQQSSPLVHVHGSYM